MCQWLTGGRGVGGFCRFQKEISETKHYLSYACLSGKKRGFLVKRQIFIKILSTEKTVPVPPRSTSFRKWDAYYNHSSSTVKKPRMETMVANHHLSFYFLSSIPHPPPPLQAIISRYISSTSYHFSLPFLPLLFNIAHFNPPHTSYQFSVPSLHLQAINSPFHLSLYKLLCLCSIPLPAAIIAQF